MGGVHLGHDVEIGNQAILANNTLLSGYVQVEDGAFLGGATIVHQHVRIGTAGDHARRHAPGQGCAALFHGGGDEPR